MFDLKAIRENPEYFDKGWSRRGLEPQTPAILKLDEEKRAIHTRLQEIQAERNEKSKKIGEIKREGGDAQGIMDAVSALKDDMNRLEEEDRTLDEKLKTMLSGLPNMLADDVPDGGDEDDNVEVYKWGEIKIQKGPDHAEIGEMLGMMDFETAAKMSGSRFTILSGALARLERALAQFMLDVHTQDHGYTECSPPLMVNRKALYGTGQIPKFDIDSYNIRAKPDVYESQLEEAEIKEYKNSLEWVHVPSKNLFKYNSNWLIPTAEVPLTNIVNDTIIEEETLPHRYTAYTPCFRSEAGSAGKDTRGMLRQHQFYKVEMVSITAPEISWEEHERMRSCAETILKKLELPFRTVVLCSGDTGFGAMKTYDLEVWLPGQECYREISSISNCGDFQARRMNARTRPKGEKKTRFVHTLNGSGVAVGRCLIAVMENYYNLETKQIVVPDVLRPYMGGLEVIG